MEKTATMMIMMVMMDDDDIDDTTAGSLMTLKTVAQYVTQSLVRS